VKTMASGTGRATSQNSGIGFREKQLRG